MIADDPLQELVVDAAEVDRQRIADALRGVVAIDKTGHVMPGAGFPQLAARQKVLSFLLGRKVAVLLDMADEEAIGPKDLAAQSGVAEGTVYPTVRSLHSKRFISQHVDGGYYLSPHQVGTAIDQLSAPPEGTADDTGESDRPSSQPKKAAKSRKNPQARKVVKGTKSKSADKKANGGQSFSPTTAVRALVADGFFDDAKTLTDVQTRLKDKQGRDVPATTLSPIFTRLLRDGTLDRSKNDEGTYEYVTGE